MTIRPRAAIPTTVKWSTQLDAIRNTSETELVARVGLGGQLVTVDLALDSPHVGVSGDSGSGKSVLCRSISVGVNIFTTLMS